MRRLTSWLGSHPTGYSQAAQQLPPTHAVPPTRPVLLQDLDWRFAEAQEEMARAQAAESSDSGEAPAAAETKPASA